MESSKSIIASIMNQESRSKIVINSVGSEYREATFDKNIPPERSIVVDNLSESIINMEHLHGISIKFTNLCRICGRPSNDGTDLFSEEGLKMRLKEKITLHTPLSLESDSEDTMPRKICSDCRDKLETTHALVVACLETDLRLRKFLDIRSKPGYDSKYMDLVNACAMDLSDETTNNKSEDNERRWNDSYKVNETSRVDKFDDKWKNDDSSNFHIKTVEILPIVESIDDNNIKYAVHPDLNNLLETLGESRVNEEKNKCSKNENIIMEVVKNSSLVCTSDEKILETPEMIKSFVYKGLYREHEESCMENSSKFQNRDSSSFIIGRDELDRKKISTDEKVRSIATKRRCGYCPSFFESRKDLQNHINDFHNSPPLYKCGSCERTYEKWSSLDVHEATHRIDKPYLCDLCGKSFKHSNNLRGHKRIHLEESKKKRHVCNVCNNAFRSKFHLREHMNQHNGNKPYTCENCGKAFYKRIQLRQHRLSHGSNKYACPICGVTFNRRGNMNTHLKRHDKSKGVYTCSVCECKCKSMSELKTHRKQHSENDIAESIKLKNGDKEIWRCQICDKIFPKRAILSNHEITHKDDRKRLECDKCGKKLANKNSLRYHNKSLHSNERPHVCQFCGESFVSKDSRLIHERIHTGERPFVCQICNMRYRCSSNLSQHMKIHSPLRPHVCQYCKKTFIRKSALNVHERIHTGLKPFICEICNRTFSQKNDMFKHAKTHRSKYLNCEKCHETFENKSLLLKHLNDHEENIIDHSVINQYAIITQPLETYDIEVRDADGTSGEFSIVQN